MCERPGYRERVQRLQGEMKEQDIAYVFLSISPDLFYLTGYTSFVSERLHLLVVPVTGDPTLILPAFEMDTVTHLSDWITVVGWPETEGPIPKIQASLDPEGTESSIRIAISDHTWSVFLLQLQTALPKADFIPSSRILAPMRRVKDRYELRVLGEAQQLAVEALTRLLERPFAGRTEKQVADDLVGLCKRVGFDEVAGVLVGSGPNGAMPHLAPTERVIQPGEPVVIDFGGIHEGYYSDCTRTVHVGPASSRFTEVYDVVRRANEEALAAIRPGVPCHEVDRVARDVISEAGYGEYFTHRLGHGIGIQVHEEPYMVEGNELRLSSGMVFTDEPGIYIPGAFGCRLEDVVAVTDDGGVRLTNLTRSLTVVD